MTSPTLTSICGKTYSVLHFFKDTTSCRKVLCIFFYYFFTSNTHKKGVFDIHFSNITSKVQHGAAPPPLPSHSVLWLFQTTRGRDDPVCCGLQSIGGASQDFNQFPVQSHTKRGGRRVLCWVSSLSLFKWTDGATLFREIPVTSSLYRAVTSIIHIYPSWTGIFLFRPCSSLAIGPKVRSTITSTGP